ncbi:ESPR-type extended signal peptide-containing protein [Dialister invisus]|uniref:ESPR-type extended signal peptide-containing protein n=1 Tax=Dialister invisus TaxID=218538 RepID=UPI0027B9DF1C|nr:ESPR-type extended signal peptide-containing protein [Dialister invisus]
MNQIYKVIWSRVKRCYVVVSEIAGSNGKNGGVASEKESLPIRAFLCALALTGCLMPSVVEANTQYGPGSSATGGDSVAIGDSAKATAGHATAVGTLTEADGVNSFVAGLQAKSGATAENSVAIGRGAQALGQKRASDQFTASTIAIGNNATATENGDIVIGRQAKSTVSQYHNHPQGGNGAVVMGAEAASYGSRGDVVIGAGAEACLLRKDVTTPADKSEYSQGVAIGSRAKVYGTQSTSIGADSRSIGHSSIAIGGDDIDKAKPVLTAAIPDMAATGVQKNFNRELDLLYPGTTLGSAAMNDSKNYVNTASIGNASMAIGMMTQSYGTGSTAIGVNTLTKGIASTGIGVMARSWGDKSLALGSRAETYGNKSTAVGDANTVGLDMTDGTVSGASSAAVGTGNTVYGNNAYAVGGGNTVGSATITETTEANGDKIKHVTAGTVKGSTAGAFGYKNTINADNAYTVGSNSTVSADGAMVLGSSASVTGKNGVALGNNTKVANENAVAIGNGSETAAAVATPSATINGVAHNFAGVNPASTVSVGKAGAERTITNVAAGRISDVSTDAINGSQLYAVTTEMDKGVAYAGDVKAAAAAANKFTRKLGEQTNIIGGVTDTSKLTDGNIGVVSNGKDTLNIKLAKDVKVDSVTTGGTVINNNGLTVGGKTFVTPNGINANNTSITNVLSGGTTDSNAANIGDVKKAAAGAKTTVTGAKQATVTSTVDAADGHTDYVVSATKTTLAAEAGGKVSVTGGTEDANGVIAYTVGLDAATKTAINNIGGGTIAAGDNKTVTGDTVNTYLNNNYYDKPAMDTKLGDKANTNLDNITNAGKTVINDIAADAVKVVNGKNTTVTPGTEAGANGTVKTYAVNVSGDLTGITSISNQKTAPGGTTTGAKITLGDTTNTVDVGGAKITNVADGDVAPNSKDAVNGGQLNEVKELAGKHTIVKVDGQENRTDGNLLITKTDNNGQATYDLKLNDELTVGKTGAAGKDGSIGVKGKDGSAVAINGKDGSIGLNGANGANGLTMKSGDAKPAVDGTNVTRLVLEENGKKHDVATLDDGLQFTGNNTGTVNKHKLNTLVKVQGEGVSTADSDNFASASGNINVKANGTDTLELQLAKDLKNLDSVTAAKTVKAGDAVMGGQTVANAAGDNETGNYVTGLDNKTWNPDKIVSGRAATEDQVKDALAAQTATGLKFDANVGGVKTNKLGSTVLVKGEGTSADNDYSGENIKTFITQDNDGNTTINVKMNRNLVADSIKVNKNGKDAKDGVTLTGPDANGTDGKVGISGKDGKDAVSMSGKDGIGHIGLNGKDGRNADMTVDKGTPDLDGNEITRIKYTDEKGTPHEVATKDDGMKYGGDTGAVIKKKLNEQVNVIGGIADETKLTTEDNLGVVSDGSNNLKVRLAKALKGLESVTTGDTVMNNNGVTINNGAAGNTVSLTKNGLDNGGNKITNVADGTDPKDAVNKSQLDKATAAATTTVTAGNNITVTPTVNPNGSTNYEVGLKDQVTLGSDPSKQVSIDGTAGIIKAGDKVTIDGTTGNIDAGKVKINGKDGTVNGLTNKTWDPNNFTSGQAATEDQLKAVDKKITNTSEELTKKGMDFAGNEGEFHRNLGEKVTIKGEGTKAASEYSGENIRTFADADGNVVVKMDKNLKTETIVATGENGKNGKIGINDNDGQTTNISVTSDGKPGVDGAPGTTTTRIVYEKPDGSKEEVATLNDGMKYGGDTGNVIKKKLNEQVNVVGGITDTNKLTTEDNLGVVSDGNNNLKVRMAKDLKGLNSVTTNTLTVGDVKIDNSGINAGNKKITNVAAGDISANSTDAVNGGQLWKTNQTINNIGGAVNELGDRMDRVGAGAAALAALHPLDFDPDDKWDVAAGYGNYKDAHAVAVGAFYRPNEDTMFSVGGSFGGGENMVNAGVSVKLGQGNHVSTSRVALAKEVEDLKAIVKAQSAEIKAMRGAMQSGASVMKDVNFPDVPKDHWAYSYVKSLADRGLLEGYPDGEFKGDRTMTRYEFAAIIYRALQNGAPIDSDMAKAIGEFDPEINRIKDLDRTRVDRISGKDNDRHKVERVRVNNESNKEKGDYRDVYGSHISPEA